MPNVKFNASFHGLKLDANKFTKAFDEKAKILVREAAREWLRSMIIYVPVWTGFARGSIKFAQGMNGNLSRYLNVAVPINPVSSIPEFYRHWDGTRVRKTPENAGRYGSFNFPSSQFRYRFSFRSDVVHFYFNEFFGTRVTGPWNSLEVGKNAFENYIHTNAKIKIPKLKDYIVRPEINTPTYG